MRSARCARIGSSGSSRGNGRSSPPSYAISPIASSRGSSTRCRAFKPSQTQGISTMPNERFEEFAERFMQSIGEPGCDLQALIDKLLELHAVEREEFNRRSEEHTSELKTLMRISYAVFRLKKNNQSEPKHTSHIP